MKGMASRSLPLIAALSIATTAPAAEPELTTPRQALREYIERCRDGDFAAAARVLDLRAIPEAQRAVEGPQLARQLKFVLDQKLWIDWDRLSDAPGGSPAEGRGAEPVGTISLGPTQVPVRLVRSADGAWRIGSGVVASIPQLYEAYGPGWLGARMPPALYEVSFLDVAAWQWLGLALGLALAWLVAVGLGWVARKILLRLALRTRVTWDEALVEAATGPAQWLLGVATLAVSARALRLAIPVQEVIGHLLRTATVILLTWVVLRVLRLAADLLGARILPGDGSEARSRLTQIMVLKRVTDFVVTLVGGALVLRQFDALRELGTSLLASASVAGIVVGLAAQRPIAMLLAGMQISLTQPLRVGDVVVIEGEWGSIEEITLTYVVVKIWDLRRLVVPITRILDAPFQNWTRAGSDLLGTVLMYADYRLPVAEVRRELERFVKERPEWDGKSVALQVTGATDRTIELRAVVSSASSNQSWDLRCAVREHLLEFVQRLEGGAFLPRVRIESPGREGGHARLPSAKGGSPSTAERNTAQRRG
jgi:small-conductance mechanosensitive channel